MNISIEKAKEIREQIGATHLIMFVMGADGAQNVSTHGLTVQQAYEAADYGNKLKKLLGWPEELCQSVPQLRDEQHHEKLAREARAIELLDAAYDENDGMRLIELAENELEVVIQGYKRLLRLLPAEYQPKNIAAPNE